MKRVAVALLLLPGLVLWFSCADHKPTEPASGADAEGVFAGAEEIAREIAVRSGWDETGEGPPKSADGDSRVQAFSRELIVGDVAHYRYEVRVGPGAYDVIGLHRVVRERRPFRPIRTTKSIFLLHGDCVGFEGVFLFGARSASTPNDHAAAVYLAQEDVDVWGIDQSWILVPREETNFLFMADWGMQHEIDNLGIGLGIARFARLLSGSGFGKMPLLGYSSGAVTGYAYMNEEAGRPSFLRHVNGFVPADYGVKSDVAAYREEMCMWAQWSYDAVADGFYEWEIPMVTVGHLARTDPDGDSPVIPGFTNLQTALYFGAGVLFTPPPWYHYLGGFFDESGMPTGFRFTPLEAWLDFLETASPYEPNLFMGDYCALICDESNLPWDDRLAQVDVPVLYLAARGGAGEFGVYSTTILGSADVTIEIVEQIDPIEEDIGHIDIWIADCAPGLFWQPLLDWLEDHTDRTALLEDGIE